MATTARTRSMTAEDLLRLPRGRERHELVAGEVRTMVPPGAEHGMVALRIGGALQRHVDQLGLGRAYGEVGFILAREPDTVRVPDAAYIARERVERAGRVTGYWEGAPDLAVEVLSPNDTYSALEEKALGWLAAGAQAVATLDPRRGTATVYRAPDDIRALAPDATLDLDDVVPGFAVALAELFAA